MFFHTQYYQCQEPGHDHWISSGLLTNQCFSPCSLSCGDSVFSSLLLPEVGKVNPWFNPILGGMWWELWEWWSDEDHCIGPFPLGFESAFHQNCVIRLELVLSCQVDHCFSFRLPLMGCSTGEQCDHSVFLEHPPITRDTLGAFIQKKGSHKE